MSATDELAEARRNTLLAQRLETNERIWFGFHRLELALIGSQSLAELLAAL